MKRVVIALSALCLGACSGGGVVERPRYPVELATDVSGVDEPLNFQDDFWTASFGDYLSTEELHSYWIETHDERFLTFGERWLEFSLREALLEDRRWALTPEQIDRIRSQPDYDSTQRALDATPGSKSE